MKKFLKRILPAGVISAVNYLRPSHRRWLKANEHCKGEIRRLEAEHLIRNATAAPDEIILHDQRVKVHPASQVAFEYFSFRSPSMVQEMTLFLGETTGRLRLLDVGALHGIFSLLFVQRGGGRSAVAVDASPIAYGRLAHNVEANDLRDKIITRELALSDREGTLSMHYDWEHAIATSSQIAGAESLSVAMTTGDKLCESLAFQPDVIKIDVEGHETKVLRGLEQAITHLRPLIFLEVHPALIDESGDPGRDVISYLHRLDYRAVTIHGRKVPLRKLFSYDDRFLLVPAPLVERPLP